MEVPSTRHRHLDRPRSVGKKEIMAVCQARLQKGHLHPSIRNSTYAEIALQLRPVFEDTDASRRINLNHLADCIINKPIFFHIALRSDKSVSGSCLLMFQCLYSSVRAEEDFYQTLSCPRRTGQTFFPYMYPVLQGQRKVWQELLSKYLLLN